VLEIGAGAGWQAKLLARKGYQVTAIDVPHSNYIALREWNVMTYDGVHIPAPNRYFDVIFTSNVLEHVSDLAGLQREMFRVLKPGGIAVHIMPTPTWILWTTCSFYMKRVAQVLSLLRAPPAPKSTKSALAQGSQSRLARLMQAALPHRHGTRGCWLSEFYLFSERRWRRALESNNWQVLRVTPNNLLYSGTRLFGDYLSVEWRRRLSSVLGSSCKIYVVRRSLVSTLDTRLMSAD
jgi:SAM-dependent methyltransferase